MTTIIQTYQSITTAIVSHLETGILAHTVLEAGDIFFIRHCGEVGVIFRDFEQLTDPSSDLLRQIREACVKAGVKRIFLSSPAFKNTPPLDSREILSTHHAYYINSKELLRRTSSLFDTIQLEEGYSIQNEVSETRVSGVLQLTKELNADFSIFPKVLYESSSFQETLSQAVFNSSSTFIYHEDFLVAYSAVAEIWVPELGKKVATIPFIIIRPEHRNTCIKAFLFRNSQSFIQNTNADEVNANIFLDNKRSLQFFRRLGFTLWYTRYFWQL